MVGTEYGTEYGTESPLHTMNDFENRIVAILVDPGSQFLKNMEELADVIVLCRDRKQGYGQRNDAYRLLFIWYKYFPDWALRIFGKFVYESVGSWADVKYFCDYLSTVHCENAYESSCVENLTNILIDRMNTQLQSDYLQWNLEISDYLEKRDIIFRNGMDVSMLGGLPRRPRALETISMAAKWVPRESSKYQWLFDKMVLRWGRKYYSNYFIEIDSDKENHNPRWDQQKKLLNKLSMLFRKMVAGLSRELLYDLNKNT